LDSIIAGIGRKSTKAQAASPGDDVDSDDNSVDSTLSDPGAEPAQQQIRPLVVSELLGNVLVAYTDCVYNAEPNAFTNRIIPTDVATKVAVTVKHGEPQEDLPTCATLNEVSRLFKYSEDQHRAFAIVGRALLQFIGSEDSHFSMPDEDTVAIQRLLLIHGMGGTGKSHVILGYLALAVSWSRPDAIGTFAITGVAAININGQTLARLLFSFQKWGMTDTLRRKYQSLRTIVFDEMSMAKWGDLQIGGGIFRLCAVRNGHRGVAV
jgi:hypothetical protein